MTVENPALRSILSRERALPDRYERVRPLWERAMDECARPLCDTIGQDVTFDQVALNLTDSSTIRTKNPVSGALLPIIAGDEAGHFVRIAPSDILEVSTLLLQTATQHERDSLELEPLDSLLLVSVIDVIFEQVRKFLSVPVEFCEPLDVEHEWPFLPPGDSTGLLTVSPTFKMSTGSLTFEITFPPNHPGLQLSQSDARLVDPQFSEHLMSARTEISAILDSWKISGRELDTLRVGHTLNMPAGNLEDLSIVPSGRSPDHPMARAEHGTSGTLNAVRVLSVSD